MRKEGAWYGGLPVLAFYAAQTRPALFGFGRLDVEPLAVNFAQFFGLFGQQAGKDDAPALFGAGGQHFAEHTQRVGQNIGDNHVELTLRQAVGQVEMRLNIVLRGVVVAGADGLFVNIDADGGTCTEFECGNGQDAGAAAVV